METILLVDDNPAVITALKILFSLRNYRCLCASSPEEALHIHQAQSVDLVIADMNFHRDTTSGEEGKALFYALRAQNPDLPIILLTGWADLSGAVELVKAGAADYLAKPWDDNRLLASVGNLLELADISQLQRQDHLTLQHTAAEKKRSREQLAQTHDLCGLVYASDNIQQLINTALQVAKADVPILITGPNGAGKEKIAEIIQRNSTVSSGPFVRVNAGAIPVDLLEAEMFGAEVGAYTGLKKTRVGFFEQANGGTLFLDEIGNLPLSGQMKLLRLMQTGEYQRLGSSQTRKAQVRIISATNTDLPAAINRGEFREDLYYRINLIELILPALAQRREDIVPLARHFAAGRPLSPDACKSLEAYDWPGNVRELSNVVTRAQLLAKNHCIEAADLGLPPQPATRRPIYEPSKAEINHAQENSNSHAEAARLLGLSRQALYRRLQKFDGIR
ncbi:MAG: Transcriptional regulatory protein ZraR [Pseudomonadota bacterium]|jgi:DNA-binding NtrC family response regulator